MTERVPIRTFLAELYAAYQRKDGYIMASRGENPRTGYLDLSVPETKCKSAWKPNGWFYTQYSGAQRTQALKWREKCTRVWDCNGLAEGIYEIHTGVNINARARNNYGSWCSVKGSGMIPTKYRVPGAAVFWGKTAAEITHVAYLYKPVDEAKPSGDWYLIEARGVSYGVVMTRLLSRKPNYWGLMDKYYDYNATGSTAEPVEETPAGLKKGSKGAAVRAMQEQLLKWKPDCLPKYGADGDFGAETETALKGFQGAAGVPANGIYDETTEGLLKGWGTVKYVTVTGATVNVRDRAGLDGTVIGIVRKGDKLPYVGTAENGWHIVMYKGVAANISNKYSQVG